MDNVPIYRASAFSKNTKMSLFIKIRTLGAEFYADRRTDRQKDMTKLIAAFHDFSLTELI
jgi:hypothetical protein